ncbi:DNA recombination protein RmuC [Candidatus Methylomirabilis lanthanidiphila]|uniref:DNA recombination protein RmuC n=1 Tax=Candidatus Methylomirabilis lanthanidiphila TaxID=2211376 RepID=A0A564ZMT2_9BACT|nr:DNA recombination protein RmuC [Candidatus Methylomirabilis lanthanidiphila]VUZ86621.1 DNA recombination protein RmuC [Candidatus Methylomirabilis lanthanidiphila]
MTEWLTLALGLWIGAALGWAIGVARTKAGVSARLREHEARTAAAEARVEEVRQQLASAKNDFEILRENLRQAEMAAAAAEARVNEIERNLAEQRTLLEEAKARLSDTFKSLAAEALAGNNAGFLVLAEEKFKALKDEAAVDLESRRKAIETMIQPLGETLVAYQQETKALEDKRLREYSTVGEQLRAVALGQATLQSETAKLVNALRSPQVRGRWGEIALRKTAELAGMSPHCDFVEQASVTTGEGRVRPDMVVKLPAGREVVVDAKVPLGGFLEALEAKTEEDRDTALLKHAAQVNQHVVKLASKEYWDQFASAPEFVVLFIPNDSFLAAAAEKDPVLVESALSKKVVIATPATFIALLRAIAYGWRQELLTENAQRISVLGQELADRMATLAEHLVRVGGAIGKTVDSYNAAVASFENRVFPTARKFQALGAGGKKEIQELQPIDQKPRAVTTLDIDDAE